MNKYIFPNLQKKKVPMNEWENYVRNAMAQKEMEEKFEKKKKIDEYIKSLRTLISIPIIIGSIAVMIYAYVYGSRDLLKLVLGWFIGTMFITSIVPYVIGYMQKKLI